MVKSFKATRRLIILKLGMEQVAQSNLISYGYIENSLLLKKLAANDHLCTSSGSRGLSANALGLNTCIYIFIIFKHLHNILDDKSQITFGANFSNWSGKRRFAMCICFA